MRAVRDVAIHFLVNYSANHCTKVFVSKIMSRRHVPWKADLLTFVETLTRRDYV